MSKLLLALVLVGIHGRARGRDRLRATRLLLRERLGRRRPRPASRRRGASRRASSRRWCSAAGSRGRRKTRPHPAALRRLQPARTALPGAARDAARGRRASATGIGSRRVSKTREATLAVAGSSIAWTSMFGQWRVEPRLEGDEQGLRAAGVLHDPALDARPAATSEPGSGSAWGVAAPSRLRRAATPPSAAAASGSGACRGPTPARRRGCRPRGGRGRARPGQPRARRSFGSLKVGTRTAALAM